MIAPDDPRIVVSGACATAIVFGQWAPPTILGFATLGAGLCLASCHDEPDSEEENAEEDDSDPDDDDESPEENETPTR